MSFLSVLKSIGGVFGKVTAVVQPLEPAIAAIPVYGPAFDTIFNTVVSVEGLFAGAASGLGAAKKSVVTQVVAATVPAAQQPAPATLSTTIDEIVAALNALQAAQAKASAPQPPASGQPTA